jgi:hypothetical protein
MLLISTKLFALLFLMLFAIGLYLIVNFFRKWRRGKLTWYKAIAFLIGYAFVSLCFLGFMLPQRISNRLDEIDLSTSSSCVSNWDLINSEKYKDDYSSEHRPAAIALAHERFINHESDRQRLLSNGYLVPVEEGEGFGISSLNSSTAVLVPQARVRLYELGKRFRSKISDPNERMSYFVINSITRTEDQQKDVRKSNPRTATKDKSTHSYGVSFDIRKINAISDCGPAKEALRAVLIEMREEGKIYLCPERNCIHVTVRK